MKKKISIITINYNNLDGLKRTVESVLHQTWQEFEFIVIDGGSTDGSAEYIGSHSPHIDYWVSEPDKGIYNAMNKGILKTTGEYLLFLNSGDHLFSETVLEENHSFIKEKDLIYFDIEVIYRNDKFVKSYPDELSFSYFIEDTLPHPATFIKRKVFDVVGLYYENYSIISDWKFFVESICKFNCSYRRIGTILSTFYMDGISSEKQNQVLIFEEKQKVLNKEFRAYMSDINDFLIVQRVLLNLKKSKKIKLLMKLGLLNKF